MIGKISGDIHRCRGCGRMVMFLKDEHGRTQILDVVAPVYAHVGTTRCKRDTMAFVSHFATCPDANDFSKKRKAES